jgi:hypothetical protein
VRTGMWCGDLWERDKFKGLGVGVRLILKWISKKWNGEAWFGLFSFMIGTAGGRL